MSKFNTTHTRPATFSPVTSERTPSGHTYEGGAGYKRDTKSELFLLAVSNMVGEHTFYETAGQRDTRYTELVHRATLEDPDWTAGFLRWLRSDANMRTASLVGAAEFTKARLDNDQPGQSRQVIDSVLQRADEPGELLGYWTSVHGRALPKPVKRGVADAVRRLYTERSYVKWDSDSRGLRFADVIELAHPTGTHPSIKGTWQGDLFEHILNQRHGRAAEDLPSSLTTLQARQVLTAVPVGERREFLARPDGADWLRRAGMTWEAVAGWLQGPMDGAAWETVIPSMGYMALLRNLRNFDQSGVRDAVAKTVADRLAEPEQVAKSRQLPMRFLSAYRAAPSLRWAWSLEQALGHSLGNVPQLPGRTLVMVDRSGSMWGRLSARSDLTRADAAATFGAGLALRCDHADLVEFGTTSRFVKYRAGESLLRILDRFGNLGGTNTAGALRKHFANHDRVVIVTDEQAAYGDVGHALPASTPLYTWNLAGYERGHAPSGYGQRHTFGGLSDAAFRMIPLIEAGQNATWPWMEH